MKMLLYNLYLPWNVLEINMDWCLSKHCCWVPAFPVLNHYSKSRRCKSNTVSAKLTHSRNYAAQDHVGIIYVTLEFFGAGKRPKLHQSGSADQDGGQTCYRELRHFCSCFFTSRLVVFPYPQWWVCCAIDYASNFPRKGLFLHERQVASVSRGRKYLSSRVCLYPNSQISSNFVFSDRT